MLLNKIISKQKAFIFISLLMFIICPILFAQDDTPKKETDASDYWEQQAFLSDEILTGKVTLVEEIEPENSIRTYLFELAVSEVHKTRKGTRYGDKVRIKFQKEPSLVTGKSPVYVAPGDTIKIYAKAGRGRDPYLTLPNDGDSIQTIDGQEIDQIDNFLALFGITSPGPYFKEILKICGVLLGSLIFGYIIIKMFKIKRR